MIISERATQRHPWNIHYIVVFNDSLSFSLFCYRNTNYLELLFTLSLDGIIGRSCRSASHNKSQEMAIER